MNFLKKLCSSAADRSDGAVDVGVLLGYRLDYAQG